MWLNSCCIYSWLSACHICTDAKCLIHLLSHTEWVLLSRLHGFYIPDVFLCLTHSWTLYLSSQFWSIKFAVFCPSLVFDLVFFWVVYSVFISLPGRQRDSSHSHVSCFLSFAVSDSIRLRSEFRLCPEASMKQDCGSPDKLFSHWRWNVICQSHENQMQKSKHTHTHIRTSTHTCTHSQPQHSNNSSCCWSYSSSKHVEKIHIHADRPDNHVLHSITLISLITEQWEKPGFRKVFWHCADCISHSSNVDSEICPDFICILCF